MCRGRVEPIATICEGEKGDIATRAGSYFFALLLKKERNVNLSPNMPRKKGGIAMARSGKRGVFFSEGKG